MASTADSALRASVHRVTVWSCSTDDWGSPWESLLTTADVTRVARLARSEDRVRSALATAVARAAVALERGVPVRSVRLERVCGRCGGPHGRPRSRGAELSIAHSRRSVVVAVTSSAALGVDVEAVARFSEPPSGLLGLDEVASDPRRLATYWCRKESVVKATGDGLALPLHEVRVTGPDEPAALRSYAGLTLPATLRDLHLHDDTAAALTVLTDSPVVVEVRDGRELGHLARGRPATTDDGEHPWTATGPLRLRRTRSTLPG